MSSLVNAARFALLLFSAAGAYGTWYIFINNGSADYMTRIRDVGPRLLPGTKEHLKTVFTGIPAIDYQLTVLTLFFWEQVDGSNPSTVHLWTSPLISSKRLSHFLVDTPNTAAVFGSIILGFVLPTVVMSLPAPSVVNFEQKQVYIAIWQLFPVWVSLVQAVLPYLLPKSKAQTTSESPNRHALATMRVLYIGLLTFAGIGQASTATLLAASKFFPGLFAPEFRGTFNPAKVFQPAAITPSTKMPSIGAGAHQLLQYDEFIGSGAMVLWGTALLANTYRGSRSRQSVVSLVAQGTAAMLLTGPLGYAAACVWARDELVIAEAREDAKKVN
ncbi:hypothetical protein OEA41_007260 [Lepraria neglecta]|uniref:Uncharacterized protein n=1 Tax=Lepraria neglecta TaxID=209136 RepID=A0AAD9ZCG5_9LECA|nr:hypothetical protein OEA41_007260 [Lepraria neglecta]